MTISAATCVSGAIRVRKVEEQSAFLDDCSFLLGGGGGFKYFFLVFIPISRGRFPF